MKGTNTQTYLQASMGDVAREARRYAGLTQEEAAQQLGVARPNISKAENSGTGRYLQLQKRMIGELAGWKIEGPCWIVERSS